MGNTASVGVNSPRAWADPQLKELIDEVESQGNDINVAHRTFLQEQSKSTFKKHDKIIKAITSKTKRQSDHLTTADNTFGKKQLFELVGGNDYGKMLSRLTTPDMFLAMHDLKVACDGFGADIDGIAFVLCTSSPQTLARLCAYCTDHGTDLFNLVSGKTKKDSFPQMLFQGMLANTARTNDDPEKADQNAIDLTLVATDNAANFFTIVTEATYDQLERINVSLTKGMEPCTLEELIEKKFPKLQVSTYLQMVTRRPPAAVAYLIQKVSKNPTRMVQIFSRYEKGYFKEVDAVVRATYHSAGLTPFVQKNLSGNVQKAIVGWMTNKYHDAGAEQEAEQLVQDSVAQGYDLNGVLQWDEGCAKLKEIFLKGRDELAAVIREQKIGKAGEPVPEEDLREYTHGPASALYAARNADEDAYLDDNGNQNTTASGKAKTDASGDTLDARMKLVSDFVNAHFKSVDLHNEGYLSDDIFWSRFRELPLEEMGMSSEETASMQDWCDWSDGEGVAYVDCLAEIADTLIATIESPDHGVTDKTVRQVLEMHAVDTAEIVNPSPDLLNYLHESFNAHSHTDSKDSLTKDEFYSVLEMMNLGLHEADIAQIVEKSDHNHDSVIEWREALPTINELLHDMCSDDRDHWIGLQDPASKLGFWYNVRDKASNWMSEEENAWFAESGEVHRW